MWASWVFDLWGITDGQADVDDTCKQTRRVVYRDRKCALNTCCESRHPVATWSFALPGLTKFRLDRAECQIDDCEKCQLC